MSELMHAITLLAHFHAFSSFTLGCGIPQSKIQERKEEEEEEQKCKKNFIFLRWLSENFLLASEDAILPSPQPSKDPETEPKPDPESEPEPSNVVPGTDIEIATEASEIDGPAMREITTNDEVECPESEVPLILRKMETLSAQKVELEGAELARRFEAVERAEGDGTGSQNGSDELDGQNGAFTVDPDYQYVDFVQRDDPQEFPTMRITVRYLAGRGIRNLSIYLYTVLLGNTTCAPSAESFDMVAL